MEPTVVAALVGAVASVSAALGAALLLLSHSIARWIDRQNGHHRPAAAPPPLAKPTIEELPKHD